MFGHDRRRTPVVESSESSTHAVGLPPYRYCVVLVVTGAEGVPNSPIITHHYKVAIQAFETISSLMNTTTQTIDDRLFKGTVSQLTSQYFRLCQEPSACPVVKQQHCHCGCDCQCHWRYRYSAVELGDVPSVPGSIGTATGLRTLLFGSY